MRKQESNRGKLVKVWDEKVDAQVVGVGQYWKEMPRTGTRGCGIYVLLNGKNSKKPYYVGLTNTSLRGRIRHHTKDHHRGKWTHFSFYQLRRAKYTKDVETIMLRIFEPPGNRAKGTLPSRLRLSKMVKTKEMKEGAGT
jgi:predicted GIY-YIG superfamily endonuclease